MNETHNRVQLQPSEIRGHPACWQTPKDTRPSAPPPSHKKSNCTGAYVQNSHELRLGDGNTVCVGTIDDKDNGVYL